MHRDDADHDRGRVAVDTAVMMATGGNTLRAIDTLRHAGNLLGPVASPATVEAALDRVEAARARIRERVWTLIAARHGRIPPAWVPCGDLGETIVLRIDAHFIDTTSRKEHVGRLRGRYGHHPWP